MSVTISSSPPPQPVSPATLPMNRCRLPSRVYHIRRAAGSARFADSAARSRTRAGVAVQCSACRCTLQVFFVPGGGGLVVLASRDDDGADYTSGVEEVIGCGVEAEDLQPTSGPPSWRTPPRERLWPLHTRSTSPIFFDGRLPLPCNTRIDNFQCLHANCVCCVLLSGCLSCGTGTDDMVHRLVEQVLACSRPFDPAVSPGGRAPVVPGI